MDIVIVESNFSADAAHHSICRIASADAVLLLCENPHTGLAGVESRRLSAI
jgi:hypothetical protein